MSNRDWTPREKAIQKAAKMIMQQWGNADSMPRAMREEVWVEARTLARTIFDLADAVPAEGRSDV